MALSGDTIPGQNVPGNNSNEGVFQHHWDLTIRLFSVKTWTFRLKGCKFFAGQLTSMCLRLRVHS